MLMAALVVEKRRKNISASKSHMRVLLSKPQKPVANLAIYPL